MKVGQLLISFAISFLIFLGLLMSETVRFDVFNSIENPFEKTQELKTKIKAGIKTEEIFTEKGEFFRLYPGGSLDYSKKNREVIDGDLFVSSQFISEADLKKAHIKNEFEKKIHPKVGQFKVGPVLVSAPGSVVFIQRNKAKKQSKIYAYDHAVNIFFPESATPFVIPAGMFIDIREDLISKKTGKLYYTKLKKELHLLDFFLGFTIDEKSQRTEDRITYSLDRLRSLRWDVEVYAKQLPQIWLWFRPSSVAGKFIQATKSLQQNYAIGYSAEKKKKRQFERLVANLVNANHAVEQGERLPAEEFVTLFLKTFENQEWAELVVSSKSIQKTWLDFERAQKTWLRAIFPDDIAKVFSRIWVESDQNDAFLVLNQNFVAIENLLANSYFKKAEEKIIALTPTIKRLIDNKAWEEKEIIKNQIEITKTRRLLTELLRTQTFFQKKRVFDVYAEIVEKELKLYTDINIQNELTLEVAQDILFFLKKFLAPETVNPENARTLVKFYNHLEIDKVVAGMGRKVFSEEELDTVELVAYVGSSGLTKDEIESLRKSKSEEKDLRQRLRQLEEEEEEEAPETLYRKVNDKESLYFLLKSKEIDVSKLKITELLEGELFRFQDGLWRSRAVSGTFQISAQTFKIIKIGTRTERRLKLRFIDSFLLNLRESQAAELATTKRNTENFIPQNSGRVAMERRIMLKLLEKEGFEAAMKSIESLNKEGTVLKVVNVLYDKRYKMDFIYSQVTGRVSDLVVRNGRNTFKFEGEFEMENLSQTVDKKVLEMLDKKREAMEKENK